jgi:hypothetical protein
MIAARRAPARNADASTVEGVNGVWSQMLNIAATTLAGVAIISAVGLMVFWIGRHLNNPH